MKRLIENKIIRKLSNSGAIYISGVKDIGKTTTSSQFASTIIKLDNEIDQTLQKVTKNPKVLTVGTPPILIDE
jgi:predicted AAA+ superfamily ATPase